MAAPVPVAMTELDALGKFIVARLKASEDFLAALGALSGSPNMSAAEAGRLIFPDVSPDGGPFPSIVYTMQAAPHIVGAGGHSIALKATITAKVVVKNLPYGSASATVAAMTEALTGEDATLEVDGWEVSAYRTENYRYAEPAVKDIYRHIGIFAEAFVSAT